MKVTFVFLADCLPMPLYDEASRGRPQSESAAVGGDEPQLNYRRKCRLMLLRPQALLEPRPGRRKEESWR